MKKFAWLFAALSICACSFVACDDDDNDKGGTGIGTTCDKTASDCGAGTKFDSVKCQCVSDAGNNNGTENGGGTGNGGGGTGNGGGETLASVGESCATKACASGLNCNASKICEAAGPAVCDKKNSDCKADETLDAVQCVCVKNGVSEFADEYESCESKPCKEGLTCDTEMKICMDNSVDDEKCDVSSHVITCSMIGTSKKYTANTCDNGRRKAIECPEDCKEGIGCTESIKDADCNEIIGCANPKQMCVNGKCVDKETNFECDDTGYMNCEDGKVCSAGKCVVKPVENAPCDDSFVSVCLGPHDIAICSNKKVVYEKCSKMSCWQNKSGAAECVEDCVAPLVEGSIQYADCDIQTNTAYNYICAKDFYGNALMAFENKESCGARKCQADANPESGNPSVCK